MRCIICGKESSEQICEECYLKENPVLKSFKDVSLKLCTTCNKIKAQNKWFNDLKNSIKNCMNLKISPKYEIRDIKITPFIKEKSFEVVLSAYSREKEAVYVDRYVLPMTVEKIECPLCSKKKSGYFESILQIRNPKNKVTDFVEKKKSVVNREKVRGGFDYYIRTHSDALKIAKSVINKYGGEIKKTARLKTRDTTKGKNIYTTTVLVRIPDFSKGDVISDESVYVVLSLGENITARDLSNDKKVKLEYKDYTIHPTYETFVTKVHPEVEVMHPESYQSVVPVNAQKLTDEEKVEVAIVKDRVFIVQKL